MQIFNHGIVLMEKLEVLINACQFLLKGDKYKSKKLINSYYPFSSVKKVNRSYTILQQLQTYYRDGFIDRYTGEKLFFPPSLKILSIELPDIFPIKKIGILNFATRPIMIICQVSII